MGHVSPLQLSTNSSKLLLPRELPQPLEEDQILGYDWLLSYLCLHLLIPWVFGADHVHHHLLYLVNSGIFSCRNIVRNINMRNFPLYSFKFVKILKIYFITRVIIRIAIIFLILFCETEDVSYYSGAEFISLIIDSTIISIFIFLSISLFMTKLQNHYSKSLKTQYWQMFSCSICRIVIDSLYLVINAHDDNAERWCVSE